MCAVPEESSKPKFSTPLKDLTIKDGESLTLTCAVAGEPEPKVSWFKGSEPINSSDIISLKYKNREATLHIEEVYPEDEGVYICKATNAEGTAETKCKLTISGKFPLFCLIPALVVVVVKT